MSEISQIASTEILDSRGIPTVFAKVCLKSGATGEAAVPSGASTGAHEACELRDNDPKRFLGKGVLHAAKNIETHIQKALLGCEATNQEKIDQIMIDLDSTHNKSKLGANAILAVSLAVARAQANDHKKPLFQYLASFDKITGDQAFDSTVLPVPLLNLINGGAHANNQLDFQEFMIVPHGFLSFNRALQAGCEVFQTLKTILSKNKMSTAVGDEGGFAPPFSHEKEALDILMQAIDQSGYKLEKEISLALDVAATEFYDAQKDIYFLKKSGRSLTSDEFIQEYVKLTQKYPIKSIEDGLGEDDLNGWQKLTQALSDKVQLVGDDLFVTQAQRLHMGIEKKLANAILIKVNQVGTLTETLQTMSLAKKSRYRCVMSHRSGETEDTFIADLAVATGCGQIKTGSLSRSERLAKYNQLLRIEQTLGDKAQYHGTSTY